MADAEEMADAEDGFGRRFLESRHLRWIGGMPGVGGTSGIGGMP